MSKNKLEIIGLCLIAAAFAIIIHIQKAPGKYSWDKDLQSRYAVDFNKSKEDVKAFIKDYIPDVTDEMIDQWTAEKKLEAKEIDGETKYFSRTARNLFRVDPKLERIYDSVQANKAGQTLEEYYAIEDPTVVTRRKNVTEIIEGVRTSGNPIAAPKRMRIRYTLTVDANAIPAGKMLRCWLPYPRKDIARQTGVKFIEAGVHDLKITDSTDRRIIFGADKSEHSTLYMNATALADKPTVFYEELEYTSAGEFYNINKDSILPYDKTSDLYKKYTSERESHIIFTPELKALAEEITKDIENPYDQAKAIFDYIDPYPWAGALEYSTIENIPMYVYDIKHGDCGQQSLLFITLCRIKGIPAHFQSGFMMHPGEWNMHDWSEIYFEGIGWVPVDMSFGKPAYATGEYLEQYPESKYIYLGGIDSWRMVVNTDYGMDLYPKKKYPRSETVDFQRGEVEWAKGNLYFPQWSWDMEIEYLND